MEPQYTPHTPQAPHTPKTPPTIDSVLYDSIILSDTVKAFLSLPGTNAGEKAAITRTVNQLVSQLEKIRQKSQKAQ